MDEEINAVNNTKKRQTPNDLKSSKLENEDEEYIEAPIGELVFPILLVLGRKFKLKFGPYMTAAL